MRDLSLHVLDLMENSTRAGASVISVMVRQDAARNRLRIVVADNGTGLAVPARVATDPFFTTKRGKRTGLGLSLFAAAAERAAGKLALRKSRLGGLSVEATMQLDHVDRAPLGDLATTLARSPRPIRNWRSAACSRPEDGGGKCVSVGETGRFPRPGRTGFPALARWQKRCEEGLRRWGFCANIKVPARPFAEHRRREDERQTVACACGAEATQEQLLARLEE